MRALEVRARLRPSRAQPRRFLRGLDRGDFPLDSPSSRHPRLEGKVVPAQQALCHVPQPGGPRARQEVEAHARRVVATGARRRGCVGQKDGPPTLAPPQPPRHARAREPSAQPREFPAQVDLVGGRARVRQRVAQRRAVEIAPQLGKSLQVQLRRLGRAAPLQRLYLGQVDGGKTQELLQPRPHGAGAALEVLVEDEVGRAARGVGEHGKAVVGLTELVDSEAQLVRVPRNRHVASILTGLHRRPAEMQEAGDGVGEVVAAEHDDEGGVVARREGRDVGELIVAAEHGHAARQRREQLAREAGGVLGVGGEWSAALPAGEGGVARQVVELELHHGARVHHADLLEPGAAGAGLVEDDVLGRSLNADRNIWLQVCRVVHVYRSVVES
mmetsp:Transcript_4298/g.12529  ORF Transcript_4298/g.12529 Transcript_4298/m.12529 type:complete len:386 (+) Transcript_4298:96-1253(+)